MASESVATQVRTPSTDDMFCKCQQLYGVINALALSAREASNEDIQDGLWGALHLAQEAKKMAEVMNWGHDGKGA